MTDDNRENQLFELEALESVLRENKLTKMSDWTDERSEIEGSVEVSGRLYTTRKLLPIR